MFQPFPLLALAAAVQPQPAAAPAASAVQTEQSIIVTGRTPEEIKREAAEYVRKVSVASTERQAARWFDPVCPRTAGLAPQYAAIVEQHVREIAMSVGAPVAKEPCKANFAIIFTDDAPAVMKRIDGVRLREVPPSYLSRLKSGTDPIRWWYNTTGLSRSAIPTQTQTIIRTEAAMTNMAATASGGGLPANNMTAYTSEDRFSRVSTQTMRSLHAATVVVQADGKPLKAVASLAAMIGLAEIGPDAAPDSSILSMFRTNSYLRDLTVADRAFLESLYRMRMDQRGEQQRRELINRIVEAKLPKQR